MISGPNLSPEKGGSIAGAWGEQKRRKRLDDEASRRQTTARDSWHDLHVREHREMNQNSMYSKFRTTQDKSFMLLPYGVNNPHIPTSKESDEREREDSRQDMYVSTVGATIFQHAKEDHMQLSLKRTQSKLVGSKHMPIPKGRSGHRIEKGLSTSGLLGEKLTLGEPSLNSLVQRRWLPHEDPALYYKLHGRPEANNVSCNSLIIGEGGGKVDPGWVHGRKSAITGNLLRRGLGVYWDEPPNLSPNHTLNESR